MEHDAAYEGRGVRIFDRIVEISASVNWTISFRYPSTPPYFSPSSERKASMVSGLCVNLQ